MFAVKRNIFFLIVKIFFKNFFSFLYFSFKNILRNKFFFFRNLKRNLRKNLVLILTVKTYDFPKNKQKVMEVNIETINASR